MDMTPKEHMQNTLNKSIERKRELLRILDYIPVNLIKQAFPDGYWGESFGSIDFTHPMSFSVIEQFLEFMKIQFPEIALRSERNYVWNESKPPAAARCYSFRSEDENGKGIYFDVDFRSNMSGATCVLNPIGKTTKEVIEYEVVCSQEAANEFTIPS